MFMKKLLIAALTCLLIVGLCACRGDGDETSTTAADITENTGGGDVEPDLEVFEIKSYTLNSSTTGMRWLGEREYIDRFYATCN